MSENPLSSYFRKPSIYITLPSKGKFYPEGTLEMPANGELPVYPMSASDEITYKTPDALYNGTAVVSVIESCVPNIKDAWAIPVSDFDLILTAIRIASYGHTLDIESTCPKCESTNDYGFDLRSLIDRNQTPDYESTVDIGDLKISLKPLTYKDINGNNIAQFEEQKITSLLSDSEMSEDDKLKLLTEAYVKVSDLSISSMVLSIDYIKTPETLVENKKQIEEFLRNCDRQVFEKIRNKVIELKSTNEHEPLTIKCHDCEHEYVQPFTLDMTNFFE